MSIPAWLIRRCPLIVFCASLPVILAGFISCSSSSRLAGMTNQKPLEVYLQVVDNYRRLRAFRGAGKIIIETPELQYAGPVQVAARLPDSLIVRVEAAFGIDVGFFFVDQQRFATYAQLENTYYTGLTRQAPALIFFHIEVSFEEIMSAVTGAVVPPFDSTFVIQTGEKDYRFSGRRGDYQVSYVVDPEKGVVKRGELMNAEGQIVARQEFSRFRKKGGVWLPQLIRAEQPPLQQRMTIFYERMNADADIAPAEFTFKVPDSAKRVDFSAPADTSVIH